MNRLIISLAIFAFASSLGFAQGQQQAPTVANPDPQIEQLKRMIRQLQGTVQSDRNAQLEVANRIEALEKERRLRERMLQEQAERERRQAAEALKKENERKNRQARQQWALIADGISGGLLLGVAIGGYIWFRRRKSRNQKRAEQQISAQTSVDTLDTSSKNPLEITFPELPDDPTAEQIRGYMEAAEAAGIIGKEFPINIRLLREKILVKGGSIKRNEKGDIVIQYPGIASVSLDHRRRAASQHFFLISKHVSNPGEHTQLQ
jgi:hypothetical protein